MTKLEKVMNGLEHCSDRSCKCDKCAYWEPNRTIDDEYCGAKVNRDALELLKEYQPKVLILEDVPKYDVLWMETYKGEIFPVLIDGTIGKPETIIHYFINRVGKEGIVSGYPAFLYGRTWRCWTDKPTEEQRQAVKWE